jgi:hypothetical protein
MGGGVCSVPLEAAAWGDSFLSASSFTRSNHVLSGEKQGTISAAIIIVPMIMAMLHLLSLTHQQLREPPHKFPHHFL